MAIAAATDVALTQVIGSKLKTYVCQIAGPASYTAGGEVWDTSGFGITTITSCTFMGDAMADYWVTPGLVGTRAAGGITAHATDTKIAWTWQTDTATAPSVDVTATTNLSGNVYTVTIQGF